MTKWGEAKATAKNDAHTIAKFLYEHIFTQFGLPLEIVFDRGIHFVNEIIDFMMSEFLISHKKSALYDL